MPKANSSSILRKDPAMDVLPSVAAMAQKLLISTGLGSLRWAERKETMDGLDRTSCDSLFQSETVLGKNEYLYELTRDARIAQ